MIEPLAFDLDEQFSLGRLPNGFSFPKLYCNIMYFFQVDM